MNFGIEVIDCENGFIVLDGNSLATASPYHGMRKKWICKTPSELGDLVRKLATENMKQVKINQRGDNEKSVQKAK